MDPNTNTNTNAILRMLYPDIYHANYKCQWNIQFPPNYFAVAFMCGSVIKGNPDVKRLEEFEKMIVSKLVSDDMKSIFIECYCKLMKTRRAFQTLLKIRRWNKAPVYNTEDLFMNPVGEGQKNTVTIMQNDYKYVFTVKELMNHLTTDLINSPGFFVNPICCKNPYTNQPFTKSSLYAIYFAIRESTFVMPTFIHQYFLSGFNLQRFMNENEDEIRDAYIVNYVKTMTSDCVYPRVREMLDKHGITGIKIDRRFPRKRLLEVMMPYLVEDYKSEYSMKYWTKAKSFMKLNTMLHELKNTCPSFGRKQYKCSNKSETYNDTVPVFKKPNTYDFMYSHLKLNTTMTNRILDAYERLTAPPEELDNKSEHSDDSDDDDETVVDTGEQQPQHSQMEIDLSSDDDSI